MADVARQIKDIVHTPYQAVDDSGVDDVRYVQCHMIDNPLKVIEITSLIGQECVNDRDLHIADLDESVRQVAADKPEPARDEHGASFVDTGEFTHGLYCMAQSAATCHLRPLSTSRAEAFVPTAIVGILFARGHNLLSDRRAFRIHAPVRWASSASPQGDELHPEREEIKPHAGHTPWCEKP
jgi:hypothetical protein